MMFDVRRNMFVMRESRSQSRIVGVREIIVPIQTLFTPVHFIAI